MYIETSSPRRAGDTARLVSPLIEVNETGHIQDCRLQFWYHMYGASIATLNVYATSTATDGQRILLWSLSGNQFNQWNLADVSFQLVGVTEFQVGKKKRLDVTIFRYL